MPGIEPKYFRRLDFGSRAQRRSHMGCAALLHIVRCRLGRLTARTFGLTIGLRGLGRTGLRLPGLRK